MPARNRARQIEKRPHRNDAAFSISEREGANLRNSNPTLWDWQERTRRSNLRQTPPRFVITIKMPSGTGPSFAEVIPGTPISRGGQDDQADRHRQECCLRIPAAISEGR